MNTGNGDVTELHLRSQSHPQAHGRLPQRDEVAWTLTVSLEDGTTLKLHLGRRCRDILFGMLIADAHDSGEAEPA